MMSLSYEGKRRDELLHMGIVCIDNELDGINITETLCDLRELAYGREDMDCSRVVIHLNSPGGHAYGAFAVHDAIKAIPKPVTIIVEGWAASAASMIVLQAADKRMARPNARFLLHEIRRWAFTEETTSQLEDEVKEMKAITDMVVDLLSRRCGKSKQSVRATIRRKEIWMSAKQALKWGLIDGIVGDDDTTKE